ncbi:LADA_0D12662g1_1 [Lachancea dasiensis]|uniref:LADA_0D12662g1_1 n=1 Tax=Lachancea dasiensis TaxID=1072105 RepID=A0A1G4J8K8_9SACH|nr:LADA_0D12662g1_1 [Lachancea dasiensis]
MFASNPPFHAKMPHSVSPERASQVSAPALPRLPIPRLQDSLQRYLDRLEPLQSPQNHVKTRNAVFEADNLRVLSQLNQELLKYDEELQTENPTSSYIEQFWYDAYLQYDESVVLNVNPFFELQDDPTLRQIDDYGPYRSSSRLVKRSARIVQSTLTFVQQIRCKALKPDTVRGTSLSMDQYSVLFGSARIPPDATSQSCRLQTSVFSTHIVVLCKSNFYWFDVLDSQHNLVFSGEELERALYSILQDAAQPIDETHARLPWGVVTTEKRSIWSNIRDYMMKGPLPTNRNNLQIIDSALFVLCLDDVLIEGPLELVQEMLCGTSDIDYENSQDAIKSEVPIGVQRGTCLNRWYDKLQLIVTQNGKAGINFEHTGVDGHTILRLATHIYTESVLSFARSIRRSRSDEVPPPLSSSSDQSTVKVPRKLEWQVDTYLISSLHFAEIRLSDLIAQFDFARLDFSDYGTFKIKSEFKVSPDAFVQMAIQAAYYALYRKFEVTYEPAMTKAFQNGRTEAIRTVSPQSKLFVETFDRQNAPKDELRRLFSAACAKHSSVTKQCASGMGQDRHLYALYCIWNERLQAALPKPSIFKDGGWSLLNTSVISTSNCGNPSLQSFGFGPVCANGFGIGYIMRDKTITIVLTSKHRQTARLAYLLEQFFRDIRQLYETSNNE